MKTTARLSISVALFLNGISFGAAADSAKTMVYADPMTGFLSQIDVTDPDSLVITPPAQALVLAAVEPAPADVVAVPEEKPVFAPGEKIPMPVSRPHPEAGPMLKSTASVRRAKFTVYNPNVNDSMEGGSKNRNGEKINSVEDAVNNGRPVTLAGDAGGSFGRSCNQRERRCTLLVVAPGFDSYFPAYHKKFPNLPRNAFIGIVEDTGSAFHGSNGNHFDIAVRNRQLTFGSPLTIASARWFVVQSPCGSSAQSRSCNLAQAHLEPVALAMIMN